MSLRKRLFQSGVLGILTLGSLGCNQDYQSYFYDGKIDGERITFERTKKKWIMESEYMLTVKRADGRTIKYFDEYREDLLPESVEIMTKEGKVSRYSEGGDAVNIRVMDEARTQFRDYMQKIISLRANSALEQIK